MLLPGAHLDFSGWQQQIIPSLPGGGCGVVLMLFLSPRIKSQTWLKDKRVFTSVFNKDLYLSRCNMLECTPSV